MKMEEEGIELMPEKGEEEETEKVSAEVIAEIDKVIVNAKKVLENHSNIFSIDFLKEIEKTLGELERVRTSSNLKHINAVCNQLYELISNPDKAPAEGEGEIDPNFKQLIGNMQNTAFVRKEFDFGGKSAGFKKIRDIFEKFTGKLFGKKKKELDIPKGLQRKPKTAMQKLMSRIFGGKKKQAKAKEVSKPGIMDVISKFFGFISAPNAVLRSSKKQEFLKALNAWRGSKKEAEAVKVASAEKAEEGVVAEEGAAAEKGKEVTPLSGIKQEAGKKGAPAPKEAMEKHPKKDFSSFFMEIDSFVAWLLFFYVVYFFLVDFSLEKGFGIPRELVITTLKTPILLNITIFLLFTHLLLKMKTLYFRQNALGSVFLLFFGFGVYLLLVINF
jgi:hypothetical protein